MPPPFKSSGHGSGPNPTSTPQSNERNEYIPSFIAKKPFYIDDATASDSDYLEHQRLQSEAANKSDPLATAKWYDRGAKKAPAATKYRKGACENCGGLGHGVKDCLERKRKAGARWTGRDIRADEVVGEVKLGWDAKRDRWNGYDASEYGEVVEEYAAVEEMKRSIAAAAKGKTDEDDVVGEDGDKYEEETDMGRKQATSTRNLRLREDTAKYLINLDLESAKYDPKTRSMVVDPDNPATLDAEDGFARPSDAADFERAQTYAWETQERGDRDKIHMQANPTEAQLIRKRKAAQDLAAQATKKKILLEKYGAQESLLSKKPALVGTSNEVYVEYDERGRIKGEVKRKEKSMYPEDVRINNHTAVWGSWWKDFQWGFACCHSTMKNSFCVGEEGKAAAEEAEQRSQGLLEFSGAAEVGDAREGEEGREAHVPNAVDKPEKANAHETRRRMEELKAGVTEAEMEKYQRERTSKTDPMAALLGKDELVG